MYYLTQLLKTMKAERFSTPLPLSFHEERVTEKQLPSHGQIYKK